MIFLLEEGVVLLDVAFPVFAVFPFEGFLIVLGVNPFVGLTVPWLSDFLRKIFSPLSFPTEILLLVGL